MGKPTATKAVGKVELIIRSDLYQPGYEDDGTPYTAEKFSIIAQDEAGHRWRYEYSWYGAREVVNEEDGYKCFIDIRPFALKAAEATLEYLKAEGVELREYIWVEFSPAYGSAAYQEVCAARTEPELPPDEDDIEF